MRRLLLVLAVWMIVVLSGCGQDQTAGSGGDTVYHSDTLREDCCLCGEGTGNTIPLYWGQENIALISLNTFELQPVEINRYDRLSGQLVEEYAGVMSFCRGGSQDGGFSAEIMLDYDRGYAIGSLYFHEDEALDVDKAANFLCEDCLNEILPQDLDQCFGVGVIHLATKEVRVFEKCYTGFALGDFYVDCNLVEGTGTRRLDLLCFYCPVRYQAEARDTGMRVE